MQVDGEVSSRSVASRVRKADRSVSKRRETPRTCESCNRMGGKPRPISGVVFQMCDECAPSEFKRGRVVERFMVREFEAAIKGLINGYQDRL